MLEEGDCDERDCASYGILTLTLRKAFPMNRFLNTTSTLGESQIKNPFLENMDSINQEEPYNPFDEEVQRAVNSARKTMQMTSDQKAKALTRSLAAAGKSVSSGKPLWGEGKFASFLRQLVGSAPDAVLAHEVASDKFQGQNFALADYAAKNRKEIQKQLAKYQMMLQKQAEDRALRKEMEELRLADKKEARDIQAAYHQSLLDLKGEKIKNEKGKEFRSEIDSLQKRKALLEQASSLFNDKKKNPSSFWNKFGSKALKNEEGLIFEDIVGSLNNLKVPGFKKGGTKLNPSLSYAQNKKFIESELAETNAALENFHQEQATHPSKSSSSAPQRPPITQEFIDNLPEQFYMITPKGTKVPVEKQELFEALQSGLEFIYE
jgi:hypothetical protein